jgi:hypothetical protein
VRTSGSGLGGRSAASAAADGAIGKPGDELVGKELTKHAVVDLERAGRPPLSALATWTN